MDRGGGVNTAEYNVQGPASFWTQDRISGRFSQPQILDPELGVMYHTPVYSHPLASDYTTDSPTPSYSPTPSVMTTVSESSNLPSPTDSVLSPFFPDAPTPAFSISEPVLKKPSHSRKRPPGHIPRPRNAFILFRSHYVAAQLIPGKVEIIGEIWNKLPPAERLTWEQKADIEKERHSRMYPGYRYKPVKLDGVIKRRVKCRAAPALSAHSSIPGIGNANGACEIIGSLNTDEKGELHFGNGQRPRLIDQEERRKDKTRCARVAELVQRGIVGERLEAEAQRLGLDRESVESATRQLQPSIHDPPGQRNQFHTNVEVLRALQEDDLLVFTDPFALNNPCIPPQEDMLTLHSIVNSSALSSCYSPIQTYASLSPESEDNSTPPILVSAPPETEDSLRGWPHRRASSLPLRTSSLSSPASNKHIQPVPPQAQQPERHHHRLYYPCLRRERAQKKRVDGDLDSDSDLSAFDHVSYHSPGTSPCEQYLSPHVRPSLQLDSTIRHSEPASLTHSDTTSPLYGIDPTHSGRPHEPVDLSAMYEEQDTAAGHEATLHSTYAINAGKAYSPIPATPTSISDEPISQQLALTYKPVNNHIKPPSLDVASGLKITPFGWQSQYGSDLNGTEYNTPAGAVTSKGIPHLYYSNDTGDSPY
ncbi:hypothetical protein OPQ81_008349 [Rhizoctonia solani]|nr:hypothetical protein OPQ81_008349 [Rhizoctonia solani]